MSRRPLSTLLLLLIGSTLAWLGCVRSSERHVPAPIAADEAAKPAANADAGAGTVDIQLLAFNDFHGHLEPPTGKDGLLRRGDRNPDGTLVLDADGGIPMVEAGGAAYFATHLRALEATQKNTLTLCAGDLIGASPVLSAAYHDEPTIELMNALGLDIIGVGNHEFDEGTDEVLRMQRGGCHPTDKELTCARREFKGATGQFLAANVEYRDGGEYLPRYAIREFEGAKIAFIGMTLEDTPTIVAPWGVATVQFKDEAETVNALVPQLRAQGVEAIVVVVHEGGEQMALAQRSPQSCLDFQGPIRDIADRLDPEVDVIASGHTHQSYVCEYGGKLITSAESYGRLITDIDLKVTRATPEAPSEIVSKHARQVYMSRDTEPAADVQQLIAFYNARVKVLRDRPIAYIDASLTRARNGETGESGLGNVIADAQLAAGRPAGGQIAFMNAGGIRADLVKTEGQPVTYGQLFAVHPFSNYLMMLELTGAQLKELLEEQFTPMVKRRMLLVSEGFRYAFRLDAPEGQHVDAASMTLNGERIDPAKTYRVVVSNFLSSGGDGFDVFKAAAKSTDLKIFDVQALEDYLKPHGPKRPLKAPKLDRVKQLD